VKNHKEGIFIFPQLNFVCDLSHLLLNNFEEEGVMQISWNKLPNSHIAGWDRDYCSLDGFQGILFLKIITLHLGVEILSKHTQNIVTLQIIVKLGVIGGNESKLLETL